MKKLIALTIITFISLTVNAQGKKSKNHEQHRSAKTGRYVTKSETKKSPSTTYTTKRKKS